LWSTHDIEPLAAHLQTLLQARLGPDGDDVWFFFYQPAYLEALHRSLPDEARAYMFGPCLAWWCINHREEMIELAGDNSPIPKALDALPIPEHVVSELQRVGSPMQVHAWMRRVRPELLNHLFHANKQLKQVSPHVERALAYGISRKIDLCTYAAYGLLYGERYDDHPALQAVLGGFAAKKTTLTDAYAAVGEDVWTEVAATAKQRAAEAATLAYQQEVRQLGKVSVRVWLVNDAGNGKRNVQLTTRDSRGTVTHASLGGIEESGIGHERGREIASAYVPVPGRQVTVRWVQYGECSYDTVVRGELPRAEGEGLAIVTFLYGGGVSISMHAEPPDPEPMWRRW
jgi:hypothetical protein